MLFRSVQALWFFTSDLVFVLLFPQLLCALFDPRANRIGSIVAFVVSLTLRVGGGEPLPPLAEQRRIVVRLREQLAEVASARAAAEAQLQAAEALPAAFLRAVFSTPAAQQWPMRKLGDAAEIVGGIQKTPDRAPQTFHKAFLTVRNVQHRYLDLSDVQRFEVTPAESDARAIWSIARLSISSFKRLANRQARATSSPALYESMFSTIGKRDRRLDVRRSFRGAVPMSVKRGRFSRTQQAFGPLSMAQSSLKSTIAG